MRSIPGGPAPADALLLGPLPAQGERGTAGRNVNTHAACVRHAVTYGGLRDCWQAASEELGAVELGALGARATQGGEAGDDPEVSVIATPPRARARPSRRKRLLVTFSAPARRARAHVLGSGGQSLLHSDTA